MSRRRAGRPLFRHRHEAARSGHEIVVVERNRPDDTFGWGVVLSDETLANLERERSATAPPRSARSSSTGTTSPSTIAARVTRSSGPRLLRHRPQAAAQHPAGPGRGARRRAAVRDRDRATSADYRGLRPGRRRPTASTRKVRSALAHVFKPDIDVRALQVHLARHAPEVRRRLHVHLRGDRARLDLGARLPVRCRHRDLHRRVLARRPGARSASTA